MKRVLLTGMSGTGKSTVINKLGELGYKVVDTDYGGFTVEVDSGEGPERLWREDRMQEVLSADDADVVFISGTSRNQVNFYPQFDHIVLLSAPVPVVATAGWIRPLAYGMPEWGPEMDFNVQCDTRAANVVAASADLTLVTLPASIKAQLRLADLPRLRASGPLGQLLALQSEANALDTNLDVLGRSFSGLPDDLVNFHWDPVTCAVAVGWSGAVTDELSLTTEIDGGVLSFVEAPHGRLTRVVVDIDADAFTETWLSRVEAAQSRTR